MNANTLGPWSDPGPCQREGVRIPYATATLRRDFAARSLRASTTFLLHRAHRTISRHDFRSLSGSRASAGPCRAYHSVSRDGAGRITSRPASRSPSIRCSAQMLAKINSMCRGYRPAPAMMSRRMAATSASDSSQPGISNSMSGMVAGAFFENKTRTEILEAPLPLSDRR